MKMSGDSGKFRVNGAAVGEGGGLVVKWRERDHPFGADSQIRVVLVVLRVER